MLDMNGVEAVRRIRRVIGGGTPIIILAAYDWSDIEEEAHEIRTLADNRKANIPIIAMTANAFGGDRQHAFAAGMNGHIVKPIDMQVLFMHLNQVFGTEVGGAGCASSAVGAAVGGGATSGSWHRASFVPAADVAVGSGSRCCWRRRGGHLCR